MSDDTKKLTGNEPQVYEEARKGITPLINTDTLTEADARLKGAEDLINAETEQKEQEDKKKDDDNS